MRFYVQFICYYGFFLANAVIGCFISLLRYRINEIKQSKIALAKKIPHWALALCEFWLMRIFPGPKSRIRREPPVDYGKNLHGMYYRVKACTVYR